MEHSGKIKIYLKVYFFWIEYKIKSKVPNFWWCLNWEIKNLHDSKIVIHIEQVNVEEIIKYDKCCKYFVGCKYNVSVTLLCALLTLIVEDKRKIKEKGIKPFTNDSKEEKQPKYVMVS